MGNREQEAPDAREPASSHEAEFNGSSLTSQSGLEPSHGSPEAEAISHSSGSPVPSGLSPPSASRESRKRSSTQHAALEPLLESSWLESSSPGTESEATSGSSDSSCPDPEDGSRPKSPGQREDEHLEETAVLLPRDSLLTGTMGNREQEAPDAREPASSHEAEFNGSSLTSQSGLEPSHDSPEAEAISHSSGSPVPSGLSPPSASRESRERSSTQHAALEPLLESSWLESSSPGTESEATSGSSDSSCPDPEDGSRPKSPGQREDEHLEETAVLLPRDSLLTGTMGNREQEAPDAREPASSHEAEFNGSSLTSQSGLEPSHGSPEAEAISHSSGSPVPSGLSPPSASRESRKRSSTQHAALEPLLESSWLESSSPGTESEATSGSSDSSCPDPEDGSRPKSPGRDHSATLDGCPRAWQLTLHLLQEPLPWFRSDRRLGPISEPRFPRGQPQMGGVGLRPSLPPFWVHVADVRVAMVIQREDEHLEETAVLLPRDSLLTGTMGNREQEAPDAREPASSHEAEFNGSSLTSQSGLEPSHGSPEAEAISHSSGSPVPSGLSPPSASRESRERSSTQHAALEPLLESSWLESSSPGTESEATSGSSDSSCPDPEDGSRPKSPGRDHRQSCSRQQHWALNRTVWSRRCRDRSHRTGPNAERPRRGGTPSETSP
ncbi:uncharacterized protein [Aphelocoma coerulescens]|uniref:uncharacterized protein n=1 Tax=Aphelocoma coerulescens TaxID=39617 RepID=UPI003604A485